MGKTKTKPKVASADSDASKQTIEELQDRYQDLNTRKIQTETQKETAEARLAELKQEAREKYETDDLEELQKKLDQMYKDNEEKRSKYQTDLDKIEEDLGSIEEQFADSELLEEDADGEDAA